MKSFLARISLWLPTIVPSFALAATRKPTDLKTLIQFFIDLIINPAIALLTAVAVLLFIWGIVQYILYASDEKKKVSGRDTMFYGIIALFVLFSFWSIVQLLKRSLF